MKRDLEGLHGQTCPNRTPCFHPHWAFTGKTDFVDGVICKFQSPQILLAPLPVRSTIPTTGKLKSTRWWRTKIRICSCSAQKRAFWSHLLLVILIWSCPETLMNSSFLFNSSRRRGWSEKKLLDILHFAWDVKWKNNSHQTTMCVVGYQCTFSGNHGMNTMRFLFMTPWTGTHRQKWTLPKHTLGNLPTNFLKCVEL